MLSFLCIITIPMPKLYTLHIICNGIKVYDQVVSEVQHYALAGVNQLIGVSSHRLKGLGFDSWSGNIPGLQFQSLVRVPTRRQPVDWSLPLSLSLSLPHFPPCLKKQRKSVLGWGFKKTPHYEIISARNRNVVSSDFYLLV